MQLSDRLTRWQWAGLAAVVVIALITLLRSSSIAQQDPISVFLTTNGSADTSNEATDSQQASKFHLLIPASGPHFRVCRAIASATMMGYPVPVLNGWMQEGDLDASQSHLAKVRTTMNYLEGLPEDADDDLVLMIDGYDVTFQIPLDVLIERYFTVNKAANAKLAARFGIETIESLSGDDTPRQTILFGPEKVCYPVDINRVGCWAIPHDVDIPDGAFGPSDGDWAHNIPLWLNSGTIIGPVHDMRRMFAATLERIEKYYDPGHEFSDSDQKYMSDVWGVQEYARSIKELEMYFHGDVYPPDVVPDPDSGKVIPELQPDQHTEFHIGIDYRSALFQTNAGSEHYVEFLTYNATSNINTNTSMTNSTNTRPSTWVTRDVSSGAHNFKPYQIFLPRNLAQSIMRLFRGIAHVVDRIPHITELPLQTNIVTKNVHGLFHYTGEKDHMDDVWGQMWFYPYGRELFEAAVKRLNANHTIGIADGRRWTHAHVLPNSSVTGARAAGALDDELNWIGWEEMCHIYEGKLFVKKGNVSRPHLD
ncbi:hypothetical protein N7532_007305 [Penicillium argentinense]|uniref:Uncharacterized protein n=1 Tax=Penicillium argentinense TaxID=1131581 RepID=A0A9W9F7N7_9EURO|nr:uncharacterized protein N7532_007305 [Penicillium argentinense]KAJ5095014.1 hypothetical protein N7532_007305 [Penicillium argentinense]